MEEKTKKLDQSIKLVRLELDPKLGKLPDLEMRFSDSLSYFSSIKPKFINAKTKKEVKIDRYYEYPHKTNIVYYPEFPKDIEEKLEEGEIYIEDAMKIFSDTSEVLKKIYRVIEEYIRTPQTMLNRWLPSKNLGYLVYDRRIDCLTGAGNIIFHSDGSWYESDRDYGQMFRSDNVVREVGVYPIKKK